MTTDDIYDAYDADIEAPDIEAFDPPIQEGHDRWLAPGTGTDIACSDSTLSGNSRYMCTRGRGHDDDHAAHGLSDQQFCRWAQS